MNQINRMKFLRFAVPALFALLISACSGSSDSNPILQNPMENEGDASEPVGTTDPVSSDPAASDPVVSDPVVSDPVVSDPVVSDPVVSDPVVSDPVVSDPVVSDPVVQNYTQVTFEITVPAYQSNALQVSLVWGTIDIFASWVGDEFWTASVELPTNTGHMLSVTFYDDNGDIELAGFTQEYVTGINSAETIQIKAEQFDTDQFDNDGDSVSNLDELIAGTDPTIDEDSLLEIGSFHNLGRWNRMSVSSNFESLVSDTRPFIDTFEPEPPYPAFAGSLFGDVDIDSNGNGSLDYGYYWPIEQLRYTGTRTRTGNSITWEGSRSAYDGDYRHGVSFSNTVTVVDKNTREFVEEISGSNIGTFAFTWETSSQLTGTLIEGSSLCNPVAGTFTASYRISPGEDTDISINKEIDDPYWRVTSTRDNVETTEYFVRELIMYMPSNGTVDTVAPEERYFKCDVIDFNNEQ